MLKRQRKKSKPYESKVTKISKEEIENLARIHCTLEELQAYYRCGKDLLYKFCKLNYDMTVEEFLLTFRGTGKVSLRRQMWQKALKGDWSAQKFLSKQHLGMAEKIDTTYAEGAKPVSVVDDIE